MRNKTTPATLAKKGKLTKSKLTAKLSKILRKKVSPAYSIIMVGPQGSGKGTQADLLSKKLNVPHISTGDLFREIRKSNTAFGRRVKQLIDSGKFVPDEITNKMVENRLKKADAQHGFILDGYPRNLQQADFLDKLVKINYCILLDVSDDESIHRIGARRVCPTCKRNYNILYLKPKKRGVCDIDGSTLEKRDDDRPEFVVKRLKKYHHETKPIAHHYAKRNTLYHVDGGHSIPVVEREIEKIFN